MAGDAQAMSGGPLAGVRIVELAGIGPGPMCAMLLADLGATVIRIDRKQPSDLGIKRPLRYDLLLRNRPVIALDLKSPAGVEAALQLVERADALIEGFRPGVTERLGTRSRRLPRAQPAPRLRPHDGLGPGRSAGADGRARHQLHRDHRRAQRDRAHGPAAVGPAEPGREITRAARSTWPWGYSPRS